MPSEPRWLTAAHVHQLNRYVVATTDEPFHLRDLGLLEGAIASPQNHWHYGEPDLAVLAGHLLLAIARDHPFTQGNKRTALAAADAFLAINGLRLRADDNTLADLILAALARDITDAEFIRQFAETVGPQFMSPSIGPV